MLKDEIHKLQTLLLHLQKNGQRQGTQPECGNGGSLGCWKQLSWDDSKDRQSYKKHYVTTIIASFSTES